MFMMNQGIKKGGYSLVEVLVAVSVLLVSIVGPMTIASKGLKNSNEAKDQTTAFFLANEAIEGVVNLRESAALPKYVSGASGVDVWSSVQALGSIGCTTASPCGVNLEGDTPTFFKCSTGTCDINLFSSGKTRYRQQSGGTDTPYRREVVISSNSSRVKVVSTVSWGSDSGQSLTLESYVYNIYSN